MTDRFFLCFEMINYDVTNSTVLHFYAEIVEINIIADPTTSHGIWRFIPHPDDYIPWDI